MICSDLEKIVGRENVKRNEPLGRHTTFRIGGPCKAFVAPENAEELRSALALLTRKKEPYFVIGRGSNLLVSDAGFGGIVISLREGLRGIRREGNILTAEGGALLSELAKEAENASLTGLEFASGIPGTVGGGLLMNAGAYGSELANVVKEVRIWLPEGGEVTMTRDEMVFGYRHSVLQENGGIVLTASFELTEGDPGKIRSLTEDLNARRREKQPLEFASAGSVFKRPEGFFAGKLIEDAGLKGRRVGDAEVSEKHAGFIVNRGNATAEDVDKLIRLIVKEVREQFGVTLEPEIRYLGEF